ncbi:hypothetical protein [Kineococcus gynurae]
MTHQVADVLAEPRTTEWFAEHAGFPIPELPGLLARGFTTVCTGREDGASGRWSAVVGFLPPAVETWSGFREARRAGLVWIGLGPAREYAGGDRGDDPDRPRRPDVHLLPTGEEGHLGVQKRSGGTRVGWLTTTVRPRLEIEVWTSWDPSSSIDLLRDSRHLPV